MPEPRKQQPNVLLITSDQQRGDCYGFEGRRVKTPHLDQLARDGTRFSACITPNVVCQPSRASILTGLLPRTHGVCDNGIDLDPASAKLSFAGRCTRAGYATGFIGKAHFATMHTFKADRHAGVPLQHGSVRGRTGRDRTWASATSSSSPRGTTTGLPHEAAVRPALRALVLRRRHGRREEPPLPDASCRRVSTAAQTWHSALPAAWHNSTWVGDRTIEFLRANKDRPFCVWASFPDPHHPFDAPEPWSRMHDPDDVELPAHRTLDLERRPWWHRAA